MIVRTHHTGLKLASKVIVFSSTLLLLFTLGLASSNILSIYAQTSPAKSSCDTFVLDAELPTPRYNMGATLFGDSVYLVGGVGGYDGTYLQDILGFQISTKKLSTVGHMAKAREAPTVFSNGTRIFIMGGDGPVNQPTDTIEVFDPSTGKVTMLSVKLPTPRTGMGSAWDGRYFYLLGGKTGQSLSTATTQIIRFDPTTLQFTTVKASLPVALSAYWGTVLVGGRIFVFGGVMPNAINSNLIFRYDPQNDSVTQLPVTLPSPLRATVATDGQVAYIFGGATGDIVLARDNILTFDPTNKKVSTVDCKLPYPVESQATVFTSELFLLFGGLNKATSTYRTIVAVKMDTVASATTTVTSPAVTTTTTTATPAATTGAGTTTLTVTAIPATTTVSSTSTTTATETLTVIATTPSSTTPFYQQALFPILGVVISLALLRLYVNRKSRAKEGTRQELPAGTMTKPLGESKRKDKALVTPSLTISRTVQLTVQLTPTSLLKVGKWTKFDVSIKNGGETPVGNVQLKLEGPFEVQSHIDLGADRIEPNGVSKGTVSIKPQDAGEIPLTVQLTCVKTDGNAAKQLLTVYAEVAEKAGVGQTPQNIYVEIKDSVVQRSFLGIAKEDEQVGH